jgi:hypothetical protein
MTARELRDGRDIARFFVALDDDVELVCQSGVLGNYSIHSEME